MRGVTIGENQFVWKEYDVHATGDTNDWCNLRAELITHKRPDSLERIADEMDEMVDAAQSADDGCEKLADLAERIRRLSKEGQR